MVKPILKPQFYYDGVPNWLWYIMVFMCILLIITLFVSGFIK